MHLSTLQVTISTGAISRVTCSYLGYTVKTSVGARYLVGLQNAGVAGVFYFIMMVVSIDRLLCIFLDIKYKMVMSLRRTNMFMLCMWFLGLGSSIPFFFIDFKFTYKLPKIK